MQSEERLFKLLIEKIRQREEQEAATSELQCQLEGQNLRLKDENQNLKQQLEVDNEKLQKTVAESKACRTQMDQWKEKLRRFKDVVNDLGKEYDTLRDELDKFKLISESLEKEKSDLMHAIDDIRLQVARAKATIDEQEIQLSKSECDAAVLRHGLEAAKKIEELSKSELASEKKRSAILESHIQNSARNQTRQLLLIREDQRKLIESFASGIQCFSEESTASNDAILSEVRTCADRLCTSVETLGEKCNSERMEVQDFTNTIHDAISQ
jgi:chromosome segregation ATPase